MRPNLFARSAAASGDGDGAAWRRAAQLAEADTVSVNGAVSACSRTVMAVGQNQWYPILGVGEFTTHFGTCLVGIDSDVHWGYDLDFDPWPVGHSEIPQTACDAELLRAGLMGSEGGCWFLLMMLMLLTLLTKKG